MKWRKPFNPKTRKMNPRESLRLFFSFRHASLSVEAVPSLSPLIPLKSHQMFLLSKVALEAHALGDLKRRRPPKNSSFRTLHSLSAGTQAF